MVNVNGFKVMFPDEYQEIQKSYSTKILACLKEVS